MSERKPEEQGAIEILEEAVQLLRSAPASSIAVYLVGAIPFSLGLLFFWTDMTRNPFASERVAEESLGVALLFVWKSVWQAVFEARLYRQRSMSSAGPLRLARLIAIQCTLQPLSLVVIPLSSLAAIPFAWTIAFFRNAGLFAALGEARVLPMARRQAGLWTRQNWLAMTLITVAALLLLGNVLILIALLPQIGRSILGTEGEFARLGLRLLNSTTFAVAAAVTWLGIDPLLDAFYVLRCFRGQALASGEDLRVEFARALRAAALPLLFVIVFQVAAPEARAQVVTAPGIPTGKDGPTGVQRPAIDPQQLDRTIREVIRRPEFAWRRPQPDRAEPQGQWVGWVRGALDALRRGVNWLAERIQKWFGGDREETARGPSPTQRPPIEIWIGAVAIALLVSAGAAFIAGRRKKAISARPVTQVSAAIDLRDESVSAEQMPESSWLVLAEDLLAKGDCRLALRALYLAGLVHLSDRGLISIRRWKSGREYRRELERRGGGPTGTALAPAFASNVFLFERGWYGAGKVEREDVETLARGWEEIRRYAGHA